MICAKVVAYAGYQVVVVDTASTYPACASGYALVDVASWQGVESSVSLWSLTPAQGAEVAGAILLLWAGAWVIRQLIRALNVDVG